MGEVAAPRVPAPRGHARAPSLLCGMLSVRTDKATKRSCKLLHRTGSHWLA